MRGRPSSPTSLHSLGHSRAFARAGWACDRDSQAHGPEFRPSNIPDLAWPPWGVSAQPKVPSEFRATARPGAAQWAPVFAAPTDLWEPGDRASESRSVGATDLGPGSEQPTSAESRGLGRSEPRLGQPGRSRAATTVHVARWMRSGAVSSSLRFDMLHSRHGVHPASYPSTELVQAQDLSRRGGRQSTFWNHNVGFGSVT